MDGGDSGDGFDPCECVWSHEFSMRRLLSMLRQSQSHCTDTECFADGSQPSPTDGTADYYIVMSIMLVIYFFMHFWMVNNRRTRSNQEITKPAKGNGSNNGAPPTPPPSTS